MTIGGTPPRFNTVSWVAKILPELERSDVYEFIQLGELSAANPAANIPRIDIILWRRTGERERG